MSSLRAASQLSHPALFELRDALRKATESSDRLNAEIAVAIRDRPPGELNAWIDENYPTWRARDDGRVEVVGNDGRGGVHWAIANYTANIDAAVTLVPEGRGWMINNPVDLAVPPSVAIWDTDIDAHGATVPLALCLARVEYEIAQQTAQSNEQARSGESK